MRHARFTIAHLSIDGEDMPLLYADLVVAQHDNADGLDWECVAASRRSIELEQARYGLRMLTRQGRRLAGDVVLVRSDARGHVFRGVGPLDGFTERELEPPPPTA